MTRIACIGIFILLLFGGVTFAQNSLPDNMTLVNCASDALQQPWDAQVLHTANDIHCYYVPLVGDIDGDGTIEIVAGKTVTNDHYTT